MQDVHEETGSRHRHEKSGTTGASVHKVPLLSLPSKTIARSAANKLAVFKDIKVPDRLSEQMQWRRGHN
jgi:hypothetical protein